MAIQTRKRSLFFRKKAFLFTLLLLLLIGPVRLQAAAELSPIRIRLAERVQAEILPRLELLAGVLSHTSFIKIRGPQGLGNEYYRELHQFFAPYVAQHPAFRSADQLFRRWNRIEAPCLFVLGLTELPGLETDTLYGIHSQYLIDKAGGRKRLDRFRMELRDLARQSGFAAFFEKHRSRLRKLVEVSISDFKAEETAQWLEDFYQRPPEEYRLVFAPALFPGGGYACPVQKPDGHYLYYEVIREAGRSGSEPEFPDGPSLRRLSFHEWSHPFVSEALKKQKDLFEKLKMSEFFEPVADIMKRQAYGQPETFFEELMVRAATGLAIRRFNEAGYEHYIKQQKQLGFRLIDFTVAQFRFYQTHQPQYPEFNDFVATLFRQFDQNRETLLKLYSDINAEIKRLRVVNAAWAGNRILGNVERKVNQIVLEADISGYYLDQLKSFVSKAGTEFELVAEGKPKLNFKTTRATYHLDAGQEFFGVYGEIEVAELETMEPGVSYQLVPKVNNSNYQWVIEDKVRITRPEPKKRVISDDSKV